jgi:MFS family permease
MIILGVGWFGTQFFWAFHAGTMPLFLKGFSDSKFTISLVLSLAGVAGCLLPPVAGYFSDRTRSRFGRRKPYVLTGMLGVCLCVLGLPFAGAFGLVALLAAGMYGAVAFAQSPYLSLLPDLTPPQQRSTVSGVMNLIGSIGLISYFVISSIIWEGHPRAVFTMVGLVAIGCALVPIAFIREPTAALERPPSMTGPLAYLRGVVRETNVMRFFVAQSFWWLAQWMGATFFTLFVVEELHVAEGRSMLVPMVFALTATLATLPLGILGDRVGRKAIMSWMIVVWMVAVVGLGLAQSLGHALIGAGLAGIPFAALMSVNYALLLDLIPEERTAEFVGLGAVSVAIPQIVGPLIGGKLIDTLGYRAVFPGVAVSLLIGLAVFRFVRLPKRPAAQRRGAS